ncbi:MAG: HAMP domain-containing histidine kinase [Bacteroides sp.]|nr:HAMP domain-containing histidine kinase [Bacteroides sp.]
MEHRIKSLYIITIIAILSFLTTQVYWLYTRYEFTLQDYEQELAARIIDCVGDYNTIRSNSSNPNPDPSSDEISLPSFSLYQRYGDTILTTRTAKIYTYRASAYDILGLDPSTSLTEELKDKAKAMALADYQKMEPVDSAIYDASGAKDEHMAWIATQNLRTERECRFTTEGIDSVLRKSGIEAHTSLGRADSMVWNNTVTYHTSAFAPRIALVVPYSQLEGQTVTITATISPFRVLPGMVQALTIAAVVSALLIVCLLLQFSTVLRLSRLDKMRTSFITTMIHELKRPISTLKMCVSGLDNERMMQDPMLKKELLAETRTTLDNLSAYFSKLRDITFNNVEQIPLNASVINLRSLFDSVAAAVTIPTGKAVVFRNDIDSSTELSADRVHLCNILNNLVENAIKYSGNSVEITASATKANGRLTLNIADNGNGISQADLPYIFRRFYRGKAAAAEQPGMGLGLTYVRLLLQAHGGDIAVESTEAVGTCFTITLPQ